ncbi:MAG: T9SS type A sorting domain-containing protein, partial [Bacteroidota bacterium]
LSNSNLAPIPEILAYPNPVASAPFVRVSYDNVFEPSTVQIVDASGRLYREDTFEPAASGNGIFALKVDNLASGLYIVKLVNRVSKASTKLLIQR